MKKILMLMLLLVITLCFTACGGSASDATPTQATSEDAGVDEPTEAAVEAATTADTTAIDAATDDQALVDSDYDQLLTIVAGLNDHSVMIDQLSTYREQYVAGNLTEDDLTNAYKQVFDDSQQLLGSFQSAVWSSEAYSDQIALLSDALEALAQAESLNMDAILDNNEDKMNEADTYMNTYDEKIDAFLTAMGF